MSLRKIMAVSYLCVLAVDSGCLLIPLLFWMTLLAYIKLQYVKHAWFPFYSKILQGKNFALITFIFPMPRIVPDT